MGKDFSDVVDKAIEDIYYCYDTERAGAAAGAPVPAAPPGPPPPNFLGKELPPLPQSSASIHSSPCPFPPSFCLETIITGPSYAVTPSPQL